MAIVGFTWDVLRYFILASLETIRFSAIFSWELLKQLVIHLVPVVLFLFLFCTGLVLGFSDGQWDKVISEWAQIIIDVFKTVLFHFLPFLE